MYSDIDTEGKVKNFQEITNCFIGLKATLFAYSPSFRELYIVFEKNCRYFLVKFTHVTYVKTLKEWIFEGFKIEFDSREEIGNHRTLYKFYDRNYFEVISPFFGVFEIINGQNVVES